ncbi:hypothetical protein NONO_c13460 [Nocardia nova SH22a]|uniref:Uncharacterized protein n=1 Tax=Nocardia nova SH22a TaxID=1415166 RepID=W5TAH8_9NOCA|nr:hypothetical protein [Nocardia nova]AHH16149.1 hypothetical protein NONO_c13460 [Nocardia nova SH22a]
MTLHITDWKITSDVSPESAHRLVSHPGGWMLSWLPGELLTREQAHSGMLVDDILSDLDLVDDMTALEMAALHAAELGISMDDVVIRLCARVIERTPEPGRAPVPPPHRGTVSSRRRRNTGHDLSGTPL